MTAIEDYHPAPQAQTTNGHRAAPALRWPTSTLFSDPLKRNLVAAELKAREEQVRGQVTDSDSASLAAKYLADLLAEAVTTLQR